MNILFNLSVCQPEGGVQRHGGGIYGEIVLRRIIERHLPIICYYDAKRWINPEIYNIIKENGVQLYDINEHSLEHIVQTDAIDLLYSPLFIGLKGFSACQILCTRHGLRGIETPNDWFFFKYKSTFKRKIKLLRRFYLPNYLHAKFKKGMKSFVEQKNVSFVTVSNHSKYALISYYPDYFKNKKIPVFYSPSTLLSTSTINHTQFDDKYFLLVSAGIGIKNNLRAIMAFDRLFSAELLKGYNVRVTGVNDASKYRYKLQNPTRFTFMGYVEDDTLHQLYHDAYGFVYPSLNEGFGYPPVEAMSFGIPIAASSFSSISEVCQDAALYFNPFSVEEIMNRILQLTDKETYELYKEKSHKRYQEVFLRQQKDLDGLIDYMYNFKVEK